MFADLFMFLLNGGIAVGAFYFFNLYCELDFWPSLFAGLFVYVVFPMVTGKNKKWNEEEHRFVEVSGPPELPVTRTIAFIGMIGIILGWIFDWI